MAYSCVMKPDFWSSFYNQASLSFNKSISLGINYENRFGMNELATKTLGFVVPSGRTTLGAIYSHFGYKDFRRQTASLACGLKLSDKISSGVQIDFFNEASPGTDYKILSITFEGGLIFDLSENVKIGIHVFNPVPNSIRKSNLPSSISAGAGIQLNKMVFASSEILIISGNNIVIRTGIEYETAKNFKIRGGFNSNNNSFSFGFGLKLKNVRLDFGFASHEKLGISTSASIIFHFAK